MGLHTDKNTGLEAAVISMTISIIIHIFSMQLFCFSLQDMLRFSRDILESKTKPAPA